MTSRHRPAKLADVARRDDVNDPAGATTEATTGATTEATTEATEEALRAAGAAGGAAEAPATEDAPAGEFNDGLNDGLHDGQAVAPSIDPPLGARQLAIHLGLFAASCLTTYWFGGIWFSATLMSILVCHELGHYVVARHHGVAVSLPFFIPLPPQVSLGTLGAVIRMPHAIRQRHQLFDVGIAGPLAGIAVALPLLVLGLWHSEIGPIPDGNILEGNSILYALLKVVIFGRWLPGAGPGGQLDVQLHPMAFAAWVGLLVTMINLIPVGQLDGGHIARAVLGDRHEVWSRRLHVAMPVIGGVLAVSMFVTALAYGRSTLGALRYASYGGLPWCTWSLLLLLMRRSAGEYHPSVEERPLGPGRQRLAIAAAVLFVLIFTPVPFRPPL